MAKVRTSSLKKMTGCALLVIGLVLSILPISANAVRAPIHAQRYGKERSLISSRHSARFQVTPVVNVGEYSTRISIGTPPRELVGFLDTGSDTVWTQCAPCKECVPGFPIFEPKSSSSYKALSCHSEACLQLNTTSYTNCSAIDTCAYDLEYGTGHSFGEFSSEVLTLTSDTGRQTTVPDFLFGCSDNSGDGAAPIVALSRSPLSFVGQVLPKLGSALTFSFCFPTYFDNKTTELTLGGRASEHLSYTPLVYLDNPTSSDSTLYYVNVTGISVDGALLSISNDVFNYNKSNDGGGTMLDTGSSMLLLAEDAYYPMRSALEKQIPYPTGDGTSLESVYNWGIPFDLCYNVTGMNVTSLDQLNLPTITIHFQDLDFQLPASNAFVFVPQPDNIITTMCLAAIPPPASGRTGTTNIIGSFQMQNHLFVFDLDNNRVGINPQKC